jgi:hypothetical protein
LELAGRGHTLHAWSVNVITIFYFEMVIMMFVELRDPGQKKDYIDETSDIPLSPKREVRTTAVGTGSVD